ncbi:MAG: dienelactone hydrolase family protein [Alphaproteobacteria bacterium]|nr:dienelactone hydrolase family protein [Alphaproteobacteria bacterium]
MGEAIALKPSDGAAVGGYLAKPSGTPKGHVIVVMEIFGVNNHIRNVVDRFAADGYVALAPQFFDRLGPKIELGYTPETIQQGIKHVTALGFDKALFDVQAGVDALKAGGAKKVGVTGFCWGGTITWLSACRLNVDAAVGYYGGGIYGARTEKPKCPTMLHFGDKDAHIPMTQVNEVRQLHPNVIVYDYPADHGFHCDERASYDATASKLAYGRTLEFFAKHLA